MKKIISALVSVCLVFSMVILSGCSDFAFNPIGKWKLTDDILYDADGHEMSHETDDDMLNQNIFYVFEKSGTGYKDINGTKTLTFTYEYNDEEISVTFEQSDKTVKYKISDDGKTITNSETTTISDPETNSKTTIREDKIFKKQ